MIHEETKNVLRAIAEQNREHGSLYVLGGDLITTHPEVVLPIAASDRVLDVAEQIMGPFVQLDSFSLIGLRADCPAGISWHRDPYGNVPRGLELQRPMALNLLIYLQDLDDCVGPLRVLPGSHRYPLEMDTDERGLPHPSQRLIYAKSGDGILLHNNLVHSRSKNCSHCDRIHVSVVYNLTCMRSSIDLGAPIVRQLLDEFHDIGDPRLLRLLGEDCFGRERYNCGFLRGDQELWANWIANERSKR